jgi:hypothetical protein
MDFDIDDEEEGGGTLFAYVFMPRFTMDGVIADRFTEVTMLLGHDPNSFNYLIFTYKQMGMDKENIDAIAELPGVVESMALRSRFNTDMTPGVFLVKTEFEITGEQMDALLTMKQRDGTLREFLRAAKIM